MTSKRQGSGIRDQGSGGRGQGLIFIAAVLLLYIPSMSYSKTITVGTDYETIGEALKTAVDGDRIIVAQGRYRERINIDKRVHVTGADNPVIQIPKGNIVEISASGVVFEGFTLRYDDLNLSASDTAVYISKGTEEVAVRNNRLMGVMFGVWNVEGKNIRIENNRIVGIQHAATNYRGNCINLTGSQEVHISKNVLSHCRDGIYMELCHDASVIGNEIDESRYSIHTMWVDRGAFNENIAHDNLVGLAIMYTDYSEIRKNLSYGNRTHGLLIIQSVRSHITDNTVIGNTKGIFLYNSVYNTLQSNLIINNQLGIHNWGGSEDNKINANSFIHNEVQIKYVASRNEEWNNNYWSDYLGWDMTGDGIGDLPYESNSVVDHIFWRYPIAKVLFASPALHVLWMLEKQFPLFDVPKVIDNRPLMISEHSNWKEIMDRYSEYTPERFYGKIEKMPHVPGERF